MSSYRVVDPATGELVAEHPASSDDQIQATLSGSLAAYESWSRTDVKQRADVLRGISRTFRERAAELAEIATREMGKPLRQALGEVDVVAGIFEYYATSGPSMLEDRPLAVPSGSAVIRQAPIGPLLGVMPWNYPYYQIARLAAPNLLLGNTIVIKPAKQCPESALTMQSVLADAGLPPGAFLTTLATHAQIETMVADRRIAGVSVTGSEHAGAIVAELAGKHMKKAVLELGGSDPFIVTGPVNVKRAVTHAVMGRFLNAGQACNAAKRIIVTSDVADQFVRGFAAAVDAIVVDDPRRAETFVGPVSSAEALDGLRDQVDTAVAEGARVLAGGRPTGRERGFWFAPTVLTDVRPGTRAFEEEIFGPVAVLHVVGSPEEAVELANDTEFGLGAVVQCDDESVASHIADRLEVGMVYINEPPGSAPGLPFGGIRRSGFGRELGDLGLLEFANQKLIRHAG